MDGVAFTKGVRVSTRKVRLVADAIRNMQVLKALELLQLTHKRGAYVLTKTLKSAVANAMRDGKTREEDLIIARLEVNEGQFLKRMRAGSRGHVLPFKKRSSHVRIVVSTKGSKGTKETKETKGETKKLEEKKGEK